MGGRGVLSDRITLVLVLVAIGTIVAVPCKRLISCTENGAFSRGRACRARAPSRARVQGSDQWLNSAIGTDHAPARTRAPSRGCNRRASLDGVELRPGCKDARPERSNRAAKADTGGPHWTASEGTLSRQVADAKMAPP